MVVYDKRSKQLSLRDASQSKAIDLPNCPTCHRPYRDDATQKARSGGQSGEEAGAQYMNPSYFRMLHNSHPSSPRSSGPPSPRRRVLQPVGQPERVDLPPPLGTEFIASEPLPESSHGISSSAFSQGYFKTFFVEEKELGRGGKGVVLLVRHVLDGVSLGQFACKRVPVGDDHAWLEKVLVEVQLLQNLSHQNLVSYRHVWLENYQITPFGPSVPCAFILQQYCNSGDLQHYVLDPSKVKVTKEQLKERMRRRSKGHLEPPKELHEPRRMQFEEIFSFFKDITSGLHHLHAHGYIHRDLKPNNCLLHKTGQRLHVMVSDFGEVQMQNATRMSTGATGTISYCAPEVLRREGLGGSFGNFTTKSDVFSLGMILYFMCFGKLPYSNSDDINNETEDIDQLRAEIADWVGFDDELRTRKDLPDQLYKFLKRLLSLDPNNRPYTDEILIALRRESSLDDFDNAPHPSILDNLRSKSRISPLDTPSPTPKRQRSDMDLKNPPKPFFKSIGSRLRYSSSDEQHPPSSSKQSVASQNGVPAQPVSSTAMVRSTSRPKVPSPMSEDAPPSPKERRLPEMLALPPPPQPPPSVLESLVTQTSIPGLFKLVLFLIKYISITQPCAPFISNRWVTYPILFLAMVDFLPERRSVSGGVNTTDLQNVEVEMSWKRSVMLFIMHLVIVGLVAKFDLLCGSPIRVWNGV